LHDLPSLNKDPLCAKSLFAGYEEMPVIMGMDFDVQPGELLSIIGPNASGKSTLLKCLARLHSIDEGSVLLDGLDILNQPTRAVARRLAFLPQDPVMPPGLTVRELVELGRHPHRKLFGQDKEGPQAVEEALRETGIIDLAKRPINMLSGGQRQRAWIALALAQGANLLLLDEPTNHLDPAHRTEVMDTLVKLAHEGGRSIVVVLHDLILAAATSDRIAVLDQGKVAAVGTPQSVLSEELLSKVYGSSFIILKNPIDGRPVPIPQIRIPKIIKD
jgi:iron complex transport system ATP-binding protein